MYSVWMIDDACCDEVMVFTGTLAECRAYVADESDNLAYIVEPDGFTVFED